MINFCWTTKSRNRRNQFVLFAFWFVLKKVELHCLQLKHFIYTSSSHGNCVHVDLAKKKTKRLEMVFCYQNCSELLWEKMFLWLRKTFEIRSWRLRIFKIFEITGTIYSNSERSEQFLVTECFFLTCSWRFLISNKLEQLEFKLEKILGFRNMQGNLEKYIYFINFLIK